MGKVPSSTGNGKVCFFSLFALKGWLLTIFQIKKYTFPTFFFGGGMKECFAPYTEVVVVIALI